MVIYGASYVVESCSDLRGFSMYPRVSRDASMCVRQALQPSLFIYL